MFRVPVYIRVDVLAALDQVLAPNESLPSLVEALAVCEEYARVRDTTGSQGVGCGITGPLIPTVLDTVSGPLQALAVTLRPKETLDGLITALLIGEIRARRTNLPAYVTSADEAVMTSDDLEHEWLINHCTIEPKERTMFTIPLTVRKDVLEAFDNSLAEGEDRDEVVGLLIGTEAECRDSGYVACDGARDLGRFTTVAINVEFDFDTHERLVETLRLQEDAGTLVTAVMVDSLRGRRRGTAKADDLLAVA